MAENTFRDRIKELRRVKASELIANEKNWRKHPEQQRMLLVDAMKNIGIADALIAREDEDGRLILIDGHLRQDVTGDQEVPVLVLDVNEKEADVLLASIDPLAMMAIPDEAQLESLLKSIHQESGLAELAESVGEMFGVPVGDHFDDLDPNDLSKGGENDLTMIQYVIQLPKHKQDVLLEEEVRKLAKKFGGKFALRGTGE